MSGTNYAAVLNDTLRKMVATRKETERLEIEAAKLRQFFFATLNMLPDDLRDGYMAAFREANEGMTIREASLKDSIIRVLSQTAPKYLTAADVRDRLRAAGFDFSGYTSNELASVSTTLRRLKPEEAEMTSIDGITAWRLSAKLLARARTKDNAGAYPSPGAIRLWEMMKKSAKK